jgi:hypothetical protein
MPRHIRRSQEQQPPSDMNEPVLISTDLNGDDLEHYI